MRPPTLHRLIGMVALAAVACGTGGDEQRRLEMERPAAQRLVGAWDVTFVADSFSLLGAHHAHDTVAGSLVFTTARHGPASAANMSGITHDGSYDLDFAPFGWRTRDDDEPPVAIARVVSPPSGRDVPDSLYVVLSPNTRNLPVTMAGAFGPEGVHGTWRASRFSAGGGTGKFTMRPRGSAPASLP